MTQKRGNSQRSKVCVKGRGNGVQSTSARIELYQKGYFLKAKTKIYKLKKEGLHVSLWLWVWCYEVESSRLWFQELRVRLQSVYITFEEKGFGLKSCLRSGAYKDCQAAPSGHLRSEIMNLD